VPFYPAYGYLQRREDGQRFHLVWHNIGGF
jgi:hypothetical protein